MGYTGINLENVKLSNRSSILKLLNDCGAMSRKDIAIRLKLTPATVTLICTELISAGILCEKGEVEEERRAGRKKILIDINYQYSYVLSISIEAAKTFIAISNLKGKKLGGKQLTTDGTAAPEKFLKKVTDESKALMWENGIAKDGVLGIGVSVPGPVKRSTGVSQHAYRIWNEAVPVGEFIGKQMDLPTIVENNVKAFAEGELIYGNGKEWENLLFIKWGPGVGSAIIIHGRLYDSQNSKTAEIGHYIVEKDGKPCRCGRRGCLETKVATHAIASRIREACTEVTMPELYHLVKGDLSRIEARNMAEWMTVEDEGMWQVLDDIIEQMARVAVNTITLLAPDKVIIYGEMFGHRKVEERFVHFCSHYDASYDGGYILKSQLSDRIEYIGPLAVAVNELFLLAGSQEN
ncbi:ROK family transcriptional regulator [Clostridium transplantifaecale]|uniref:ROK family transcriptional regulator n=1 Tax=Clostridium transplantifaecale TaxID=2479838 RepID=UPI000F641621|nr:ROK family transcriptional regulator [Clostridium transplantifaecale]